MALRLCNEASCGALVTKRIQQFIHRAAGREPVVKVGSQFFGDVDLLFATQPAWFYHCANTIAHAWWESASGKEALQVVGLRCLRLSPPSDP